MKKNSLLVCCILTAFTCRTKVDSNQEMVDLLKTIYQRSNVAQNFFSTDAKLSFYDSVFRHARFENERDGALYYKAATLLELGEEKQSIEAYEILLSKEKDEKRKRLVMKGLAIAYMRVGERTNCLYNHSGESCVFPVKDGGIHFNKRGSSKAIALYEEILTKDPNDLESRWLLNIAYMTVGGYPAKVPPAFLLKGLDADTSSLVKPFIDVAVNTGLNTSNMAGGNIVDDFNNDGYLDIITSAWDLNAHMHYCKSNGDGTFTDISALSGLRNFTGGLNIMQTDYNNDGLKDIFVLRGAWKKEFGNEPNSLLRNNGDGTFTDVTKEAGLLSFYPTQTATWADFNNDGWLDVFIGNEPSSDKMSNPCELFMNRGDGSFINVATETGSDIMGFVKGVSSGDYDNDGWVDLFISTLNGKRILLRNEGLKNGIIHFADQSIMAGLRDNKAVTFGTWFWDYDNDGWLDILACDYNGRGSLAPYCAAEALGLPDPTNAGKLLLYHNNHNGGFTNVSEQIGLNKVVFAMGGNFGDIDNDGYLDIYCGTGNPDYRSLVPNKMFKNINGQHFTDVTTTARVGNLQKGHGVSFADLDNDGDLDIYIETGGAFQGDAYQNSLYLNPGQNNNHWIDMTLEGVSCNRPAIGAKIKVSFTENGLSRTVYRQVNSGGSFGANPLRQHIGIGAAENIESVEIIWPGINRTQVFKNIKPNQSIKIKEGDNSFAKYTLKKYDFTTIDPATVNCGPAAGF